MYLAWFDASVIRKPDLKSKSSLGYLIEDGRGNEIRSSYVIEDIGDATKAEFYALKLLLEEIKKLDIDEVKIHGDHIGVFRYLQGKCSKQSRIMKYTYEISDVGILDKVKLIKINRSKNKAHRICRRAWV